MVAPRLEPIFCLLFGSLVVMLKFGMQQLTVLEVVVALQEGLDFLHGRAPHRSLRLSAEHGPET